MLHVSVPGRLGLYPPFGPGHRSHESQFLSRFITSSSALSRSCLFLTAWCSLYNKSHCVFEFADFPPCFVAACVQSGHLGWFQTELYVFAIVPEICFISRRNATIKNDPIKHQEIASYTRVHACAATSAPTYLIPYLYFSVGWTYIFHARPMNAQQRGTWMVLTCPWWKIRPTSRDNADEAMWQPATCVCRASRAANLINFRIAGGHITALERSQTIG